MFKNILFGLGGVGVVGGGGYMIYNATRSGDEDSKSEKDSKSDKGSSSVEGEGSSPSVAGSPNGESGSDVSKK